MTDKAIAYVPITEELLADGRGLVDWLRAIEAAREAAKGERYNGVYQRGYQAGAQAAFDALVDWQRRGGVIGLPMSDHSLHARHPSGMSVEIMSLLALRPWDR